MTAVVPPGLPRLKAGAHLQPEDGACLMEYVSVLAGVRFSDRPGCTDPTLAALARLVNDSCSDAGRPQLATFAPVLAGTPRGDAARTAALVLAVVRTACAAVGATPTLTRQLHRAERRQETVTGTGWRAGLARRLEPLHAPGPARHRLEVSVRALGSLSEERRDAVLVSVLAAGLSAYRPADARWTGAQVTPPVVV